MNDERKRGPLEDDDLDRAVISADDTGMVAQQHLIVEEELAESGITPENET